MQVSIYELWHEGVKKDGRMKQMTSGTGRGALRLLSKSGVPCASFVETASLEPRRLPPLWNAVVLKIEDQRMLVGGLQRTRKDEWDCWLCSTQRR
jgi:hypothetical protein